MRFREETPNSILFWNQATFNSPTPKNIANRTNVEIAELLLAIHFNYARESILEELADVCIMSWAVAAAIGEDARPGIDEKWRPKPEEWQPEVLASRFNSKYATFLYNFSRRPSPGFKEVQRPFRIAMQFLEMLIEYYSVDIAALVDAKMQINRNRKWKNVDGGNYQHVA